VRATAFLMSALFLLIPLTSIAKERPRVSKKSPPLTGTYVLRGRKGAGGTLLVRQLSPNRIDFHIEYNRGAPSYNSGVARSTIDVLDGIAVYRISEFNGPCELKFNFKGAAVSVSQTGDDFACGFGHGVYCGGTYHRKSRKRPKFTDRD
jgi:hypothetical protein